MADRFATDVAVSDRADASLDDRYLKDGRVYLTGVQALVRLVIEQQRRDRAAGLRTGTFISGYPGSPLGSYDLALDQARQILGRYGVLHVPAANEELAATAISGTQMLDRYPHSEYDGVVALWYGKGPGVDRSGDAMKHGNFAGTSRHGAVVLLAGEDHEAKSSTMPFQDDYAFMSHGIPILYPASVTEFIELGLHAIELSRFSGCWVALKLVAQLCDGGETIEVGLDRPGIVRPGSVSATGAPWRKPAADFTFFPGLTIETERQLHYERHAAVRAYARANGLDRILVSGDRDRVGIISAGKSAADLRQALGDLGLGGADDLRRAGIRVLQMGLIYPIDPEIVRRFAEPLDEVIVIEEKRGFIEAQVKEALSGRAIRVVGKLDETGVTPLFPIQAGLDADIVAERLGPRLLGALGGAHEGIERRLAELRAIRARRYDLLPLRTPNYCSGCPHNISTKLLEGELAWGSPGCHSFASVIEQPERHIESMTQYGGEGLPWIGLGPYTDREHMVQHVGDGSLFHSSYLNIRFATSVGANLTFKILFNGSIANTGAQTPTGGKTVSETVKLLKIEGVKRIAVLTKDVTAYQDEEYGEPARVFDVAHQEQALRWLRETRGVTVLIYDGMCANERRRRQKRGTLPTPSRFVMINEEVCENCGHCGALTNCMSLQKVETEFGPKTQVHQSSCAQDESCLGGDCPSFIVVETRQGTGRRRRRLATIEPSELPEPRRVEPVGPYSVYLPGVGGTGVLTVNAILAYAAMIDGRSVRSYDQTGAAQKWGAVVSSLVIDGDGHRPEAHSNKVGAGRADLYLALDLMGGSGQPNLDRCDPARTVAVINTSLLPSGEMVRDVRVTAPRDRMAPAAIDRYTRAERNVHVPAGRIAEQLFGDHLAANVIALGAAYQAGLLPLSSESIESAIRLNGTATEQNLQAFRYGRLFLADPARVAALVEPTLLGAAEVRRGALARLSGRDGRSYEAMLARSADLPEPIRRLLAVRLAKLIDFQSVAYAADYADFVAQVAAIEHEVLGAPGRLTDAVTRHLYKLLAYKDEYEVARLHVQEVHQGRPKALFVEPRRVTYLLHPPLLRALGLKRKLALDARWIDPFFRLLQSLKGLRGTPFDPFGHTRVRRAERRLPGWYRDLIRAALERLTPETVGTAVEIAELPDLIRGYERIKLDAVRVAEQRATELVGRL